MTTKRFLLMLLVMLMSVTGAWAQKLHLTKTNVSVHGDYSNVGEGSDNAFDNDLNTFWSFYILSGNFIEFKTDFPVLLGELKLLYKNTDISITNFKLIGAAAETNDWENQDVLVSQSGLSNTQVEGPFSIDCSEEKRYQVFRLYFYNRRGENSIKLKEIELYVKCDHQYSGTPPTCSKCGYKDLHYHDFSDGVCSCGLPHPHQFNSDATCTVCGYSVSDTYGFVTGVNETKGGSTPTGDFTNLFDGNNDTKWTATPTAVAIFKTAVPSRLNGYSFSTNLIQGHPSIDHPRSWKLYGLDELSDTWVELHSVTDASVGNGWNNYRFINEDGPEYSYFKLEITDIYTSLFHSPNLNIGELALDVKHATHEHNYSTELSSDDSGHWYQCLNRVGVCNALQKDFAAHTHSRYPAVCDVCGHVNTHDHVWDSNVNCTQCGIPHTHQFNDNGSCTMSGCGYSVTVTDNFISSVNEMEGSTSTDDFMNLFDGDNDTKWTAGPTAVAIFKTSVPCRINGYSFSTNLLDGHPEICHPGTWTLYGLNESNEWEIIHSLSNQCPNNGWNSYRFINEDGPEYSYFKLEITDVHQHTWTSHHLFMGGLSLDILAAEHQHLYTETWYSNEQGHWHHCINQVSECNKPTSDIEEHVHTTYSMICDVCGYITTHDHVLNPDTKCCTLCGVLHEHQFDANGKCNLEGCGYKTGDNMSHVTCINETIGGSTPTDDVSNLFDGKIDTKWTAKPTAVAIFKTDEPTRINGISFYSSIEDIWEVHPSTWTIYGLNESNEWEPINSRSNQFPITGWNSYRFNNEDGPIYSYYKWEITALTSVYHPYDHLNVGELCLDMHVHTFTQNIIDGQLRFICNICGYDSKKLHDEYYSRDYMSMTAVGGDVTIGAFPIGNPTYVLQYSADKTYWTDYAVKDEGAIVTIPKGQTYYFRTASPTVQKSVMDVSSGHPTVGEEYWNFTMSGTGTIKAGGNIMSLLDQTCQSLTVGDFCFIGLFVDCTLLTDAPKLPATTLGESCYDGMFAGCTKLQKAPHLPATQLPLTCYADMFEGCESLNYVEADFTETLPTNRFSYTPRATRFDENTEGWLSGTAAEGNLVLKREMIEKNFIDTDHIDMPTGWRKALKIWANEDPDNKGKFYTTYYDNKNIYITDDFKAYTGSIESSEGGYELRLDAISSGFIPSNTGVLIYSNKPDVVLPIYGYSIPSIEGNVLTGTNTDASAPANCYILSYGQDGLGFYRYAVGKTLSAHKAYLVYQHPAGTQARALRMVFDEGEKTGIEAPLPTSIEGEEVIYNLQGVRLNKLQKGINIVNRKKIIVK